MFRKVRILFLAADPLSLSGSEKRLELDGDVRRIQDRMEEAERDYGRTLKFLWRLAVRSDELTRALRQTRPDIVHFSGHGGEDGLYLMAPDGYGAQQVDPAALTRIFQVFPNRVRLVVLSACHSKAQAEAIADVVGCAIGTPGRIMDLAAIQFNAEFYRAVACGESVQAAFDQASAEVGLNQPHGARPDLIARGVDPTRLRLVPRFRRLKHGAAVTALLFLVAAVITSWPADPTETADPLWGLQLGDCGASGATRSIMSAPTPAAGASTSDASSVAATTLEEAKSLCAAGNYDAAFPLFKEAANAGNAEAMGFVGIAYLTGEGTRPEPQLGFKILRDAADKDDLRSMQALAFAHQNGYGVKQRSVRWAKHWLRKASEAGDPEAMRRLGVIYRDEQNDSALFFLPRAVGGGSVDAAVDLAGLYDRGRMVPRDTMEVLRLHRWAAERGSSRGLFAMGRAYQKGAGVAQSYDSAIAYYLKAACAGSADAMNTLGALYQQGAGVPKDHAEATRWFRLADAAGSEVAEGNLRTLKVPDNPRRWKGLVGKSLAWLGLSESRPRLACEANAKSVGGAEGAPRHTSKSARTN